MLIQTPPQMVLPSQRAAQASVSAAVQHCGAAEGAAGGSAVFAGQMLNSDGAYQMALIANLEVRVRGAQEFQVVESPGLGVWHRSEPSVKLFRYLAEVTNLSAHDAYRVRFRYRWLGPGGRTIRAAARRSAPCVIAAGAGGGEAGSGR